MNWLREVLNGKKSYLCAGALGVVTAGFVLGLIDGTTYVAVVGFLGAGYGAAMRAALTKGI